MRHYFFAFILILGAALYAQEFSFDQFVGTWNGNSYSQNTPSWNAEMKLVIEEDGYYTDSSGIMMPSIYPETQQVEYSYATNRVHFWYLSTVYAGNYFYTHYYFEVIYYDGTTLHLAYNFWDDPEPYPDTHLLILEKEGATTEGTIEGYVEDFDADFPIADATVSLGNYTTATDQDGYFTLTVPADSYEFSIMQEGHIEYVDNLEVIANENTSLLINLQHIYNPPENLEYQFNQASITLNWDEPVGLNLSGFEIYRNSEVVAFTTDTFYQETDLPDGIYTYTISAVYGEYESAHSNQAIVEIYGNTSAEDNHLPQANSLLGNYPNPFNPTTNIKFAMSESGPVTIDIYNSKGMKLLTLIDETKAAGNHSIVWNGQDSSGQAVSSGVYFYQMRSGNYHKTQKMMLMK